MIKKLFNSLKFRMIALFSLLIISVFAIFVYNYHCTIETVRHETYLAMEGTTSFYSVQLEDNLYSIEIYLINYINEKKDIDIVANNDIHTTDWAAAIHRIQSKFTIDRSLYPVDSFFFYKPETGLFFSSTSSTNNKMKGIISASIDDGTWSLEENRSKWIQLEGQGEGYIYRAVSIYGCYIGAWIDAPKLLNNLSGDGSSVNFYFADKAGSLLTGNSPIELTGFEPKDSMGYIMVSANSAEQMLIYKELPFASLYLTTLIPNDELERGVKSYMPTATLLIILLSCIMFASVAIFLRWIFGPVNNLTHAIKAFKTGNFDVKIETDESCSEFAEVNNAFNEMVTEIAALKIDVYEEKIVRQETEMEYLKLQITPHFLINCLNTISQLTDTENPELVLQMSRELSRHIRYTLSSSPTVPLSMEIAHVKNYVKLSNIRYNGSIKLITNIADDTLGVPIIPLLISNFVENTVKHEVSVGKTTEINISTELTGECLHISIWDSGTGFPEETLRSLSSLEDYLATAGNEHIGIKNVCKRANLLLGQCRFLFSNRENSGANIEIYVPYPIQKGAVRLEPADS